MPRFVFNTVVNVLFHFLHFSTIFQCSAQKEGIFLKLNPNCLPSISPHLKSNYSNSTFCALAQNPIWCFITSVTILGPSKVLWKCFEFGSSTGGQGGGFLKNHFLTNALALNLISPSNFMFLGSVVLPVH